MDAVRAVVAQRLRSGTLHARVEVIPKRRLRVTLFDPDPAARVRVEHVMAMTGTLEFRILANRRDHRQLIRRADADPEATVIRDSTGERLGWWVPLAAVTKGVTQFILHYPEIKTRTRKVGNREVTRGLGGRRPLQRHGRLFAPRRRLASVRRGSASISVSTAKGPRYSAS